ncbi:hypothetical protein FRC04_010153 [Tulasnella sp. 424]|nr:hypothetical protein FRC04_010153 [Tulasnella sp. 424]KAG8972560.1 hypothetical protein FRC05_009793 [Tulasnella sp. 425]
MSSIYGPLPTLEDAISAWTAPPMAEGHRGRYLWTDGFAVINFLTLYRITSNPVYIGLAKRLVTTVHDTLGKTRDLSARLPNATDASPLRGGLRIGKVDEEDDPSGDGDGQYFHYLTVWMFALNRVTVVTGDTWYNDQAIDLAQSVLLGKFLINPGSPRPRMFWKMSIDLSCPLVFSEGNLDPIDGYVTYKILQKTNGGRGLEEELKSLKKIVDTKWKGYSSNDPLDLGMTLWTVHLIKDEEGEEWAKALARKAMACLRRLVDSKSYFERPASRRLAFREFGTAMGLRCCSDLARELQLEGLADEISREWETFGLVPEPTPEKKKAMQGSRLAELMPITQVMYASALVPGLFKKEGL